MLTRCLLASFMAVACLAAFAATATAATVRGTLSATNEPDGWLSSDVLYADIATLVIDSSGNVAFYGVEDGIPRAILHSDQITGTTQTESFEDQDSPSTRAFCFYAQYTAGRLEPGVMDVTLSLRDPGGGVRSLTRTVGSATGDFDLWAPLASSPPGAEFPHTQPFLPVKVKCGSSGIDRCAGKPATVSGTDNSETLRGTQGADVIVGLGGNDKIKGEGGKDTLCGGAGDDDLRGGSGKDTILGGKGKDRLKGDIGRDTCKGGKGKDSATGCEVEKSI